jgi:hypothetical protein
MIKRKQFEKFGGVALAGLCVILVIKLVSEIMGNPAPVAGPETTVSSPSPNPAPPGKSAARKATASPNSVAASQVQALGEYAPKPLPDVSRNPFDFGPPPLTPAQKAAQAARAAGGALTGSSAPAPPQIPLRAIGYSEKPGVGPEAYLVDSDDVYIVHDGDVVSQRYKVLKITSLIVEVQDGASGERAQLPIPQVQ